MQKHIHLKKQYLYLLNQSVKKINGKVDVLGFADINSEYDKLSEFLYAFSEELNDTLIAERDENVLNLIENEIDYQYSGCVIL